MKLYIDTRDRNEIKVGLGDEIFKSIARDKTSQKLLPFIMEILKKKKKNLSDLTEIKVETGPGSFTGLRIGVSVANVLGWSLGIKVNGKDPRKNEFPKIIYG